MNLAKLQTYSTAMKPIVTADFHSVNYRHRMWDNLLLKLISWWSYNRQPAGNYSNKARQNLVIHIYYFGFVF